MLKTFDNENEVSVVEAEAVEEVVVPFIRGAQALHGHLHEDETHPAVAHHQDGTSTPTFRPGEAIEELVLEAGLVHDQFRAHSQGLLRDLGLHFHTAKRL